jgi:hypothetical protein
MEQTGEKGHEVRGYRALPACLPACLPAFDRLEWALKA